MSFVFGAYVSFLFWILDNKFFVLVDDISSSVGSFHHEEDHIYIVKLLVDQFTIMVKYWVKTFKNAKHKVKVVFIFIGDQCFLAKVVFINPLEEISKATSKIFKKEIGQEVLLNIMWYLIHYYQVLFFLNRPVFVLRPSVFKVFFQFHFNV